MNKVASVTVKTFKELLRQRRTLVFTIAFPVVFMLIFGFVFGRAESTTFQVAVINEDEGSLGATYVDGLSGLKYADGTQLVKLHNVTNSEQDAAVREGMRDRDIDLIVRVPANFTADLTPPPTNPNTSPLPIGGAPQRPAPPKGATVDVVMDAGSPNSQAASQIVNAYTQAFAAAATGQQPLVTETREVVTSDDLTAFDYIAPGLLVYAVLMMAPQAAALLAHESETRTLERLKLSRVRTWELLLGVSLAQLLLGFVALALTLGVAVAMGFHPQGSLLVGLGVAMVAAMSTVGVGMVIAAFAKRKDDAANTGALFAVPASFLSGAFFAIPGVWLFQVGGRWFSLYDVLPSTWAIRALRSIFTFGQPIADVAYDLTALVVLSVVFFGAGAWLFTTRRMRTSG